MQGIKYTVDLVLCIDATGSMSKIINDAKNNAIRFYEDLNRVMEQKTKSIDQLRIRTIVFRDYYHDGPHAMKISPFFTLPEEKVQFDQFISVIQADGGGDEPESGLEALALAIRSPWAKDGDKRRQIIIVWTDASAHSLEKNAGHKPPNYPEDMFANFDELADAWEGQYFMSNAGKRLLIYAPDAFPWADISNFWSNTIHYPSEAGKGLSEIDYQTILDAIANSV